MSEPAEKNVAEVSDALETGDDFGNLVDGVEQHDVSGEESDEYDVNDEEEEDAVGFEEEEEEEDADADDDGDSGEPKSSLTAFLIGEEVVTAPEADQEGVDGDDDDDEYAEDVPEAPAPGKKRSISELAGEEEASEESEAKKLKA